MTLLALWNRLHRPPDPLEVGDVQGRGVVAAIHPRSPEPNRSQARWAEMPGRTRSEKRAELDRRRRAALKARRAR